MATYGSICNGNNCSPSSRKDGVELWQRGFIQCCAVQMILLLWLRYSLQWRFPDRKKDGSRIRRDTITILLLLFKINQFLKKYTIFHVMLCVFMRRGELNGMWDGNWHFTYILDFHLFSHISETAILTVTGIIPKCALWIHYYIVTSLLICHLIVLHIHILQLYSICSIYIHPPREIR